MRTIYIVNLSAKNSYSRFIWRRIKSRLHGTEEVYYTNTPEEASKKISELAEQYKHDSLYIIGVGGDGTISKVIEATLDYENITIGYVPAGSGNDFARGFNWSNKPIRCLEKINEFQKSSPHLEYFDAGIYELREYRNGSFVNNIGVGFDAAVAQKSNASKIKKLLNRFSLGKLIYAIFIIKEALVYKTSTVHLTIDNIEYEFENTWFITCSNQPYYGGGMIISPEAKPDDGKLNLTIVHNLSRHKLLLVFLSVFFGKHTHFKEVQTISGKDILINTKDRMLLHVDGDSIGTIHQQNSLHITIKRESWKMFRALTSHDEMSKHLRKVN
jgi:diacylglycerol kinase (ATP)